jgi:SNF2 family DNA or RNA helicase
MILHWPVTVGVRDSNALLNSASVGHACGAAYSIATGIASSISEFLNVFAWHDLSESTVALAFSGGGLEIVPVLRLWAGPVVVMRQEGLGFEEVELTAPLIDLWFDDGYSRVRARDSSLGTEFRRILEQLGCVEIDEANILPPVDTDPDYVVGVDGELLDFCTFTAQAIPKLRALGWHVDIDPGYPYRVIEPADVRLFAKVSNDPKRIDWFNLELGIDVEGKTYDLLPLVLDVLAEAEEKSDLRALERRLRKPAWFPISETEHALIPAERLRALVRVVLELYQGRKQKGPFIAFPAARAAALVRLERTLGRGLHAPPGLLHRMREIAEPAPDVETPAMLRADLRPYQRAGISFLQHASKTGGCVLADDMGLGKTLQTIAHVCIEKAEGRLQRPVLVVGPTSLAWNWTRELQKFAPHLEVTLVHGKKRRLAFPHIEKSDVVVTTYPVLVRDQKRFAAHKFSWLVMDEAQTVKNARSDVHKAVRAVRAEKTVALSGTPVENDLGELWSIFNLVRPGLLGDEASFREYFRNPIENKGDVERLATLRDWVAPYLLRRTKVEVARDLPPKTELLRPVELSGAQRDFYEHIRVAAHAAVRRVIREKGLARSTIPILGALMKLRQVCCDPRLVAMDAARDVCESAKYDAFFSLCDAQLAEGRHILVFSQFTSMLALLARGLEERKVRYAVLTGQTQDRRAVVDRFERGEADVMLVSLKAGGTGLNLVRADTVIHYDPWWNPAAEAQATDRAYRIGQTQPVFVHKLYAAGSVEERVMDLQRKKLWLSRALLGDGAAESSFTPGDVETLFAPID